MRKLKTFLLALIIALPISTAADTVVPGQVSKSDADQNGYPDVGEIVVGKYTSVYAYDASGAYYWDLGDGRIQSSPGISSVADLDQATLTTCTYQVMYRGSFDNNAFLDSGWIMNNIVCTGYDYPNGTGAFSYMIVHKTDRRYTGDPEWAEWGGDWEYFKLVEGGVGNLPRMGPQNHNP